MKDQMHRAFCSVCSKIVYGELVKKSRLFRYPNQPAEYLISDAEGEEHNVLRKTIELIEFEVIGSFATKEE